MDETQPSPPLGEETISHYPELVTKESEMTRRFYILLLGIIVIVSIIAVVIMVLDDPNTDIAAVVVLGGVSVGSLATLAANDRR